MQAGQLADDTCDTYGGMGPRPGTLKLIAGTLFVAAVMPDVPSAVVRAGGGGTKAKLLLLLLPLLLLLLLLLPLPTSAAATAAAATGRPKG